MSVITWLLGAFARLFTLAVSYFTATKVLLLALFMVVMPLVLNNLIYEILEVCLEKVNELSQEVDIDASIFRVYEFVGLAGWLITVFKIPESFSIVVSGIAVSFTLRSIPFVRW